MQRIRVLFVMVFCIVAIAAGDDVRMWSSIEEGTEISASFIDEELALVRLGMNVTRQADSLMVMVSNYDGMRPPLTPELQDPMYQYFEIDARGFTDLSDISLTFKVPQRWLAEHGVAPGEIEIYAFSEGDWIHHSPELLSNAQYAIFAAEVPHLGIFAIGQTDGSPPTPRAQWPEIPPAAQIEEAERDLTAHTIRETPPRRDSRRFVATILFFCMMVLGSVLMVALHHRRTLEEHSEGAKETRAAVREVANRMYGRIQELVTRGLSREKIQQELIAEGWDIDLVSRIFRKD